MRHFVVLFIHSIVILTQLLQPGGVRSLVAESLLLKHQLLSRIAPGNDRAIYPRGTASLPAGWRSWSGIEALTRTWDKDDRSTGLKT
jgi:hypothetical protein